MGIIPPSMSAPCCFGYSSANNNHSNVPTPAFKGKGRVQVDKDDPNAHMAQLLANSKHPPNIQDCALHRRHELKEDARLHDNRYASCPTLLQKTAVDMRLRVLCT